MIETLPSVWAITAPALREIEATFRAGEHRLEKVAASRNRSLPKSGRTAAIGIYGPISQRGDWWSGTSTMEVGLELQAAMADPTVDSVVLDIASPGGTVSGVQELSDAIYKAREKKPIYAVANSLAASAAYWIGSAATRLYAAPGAEVGSIGVYAMHIDMSKMNEQLGVKPTFISAGKYKIEGNPHEPLSAEAKASMQASVDEVYSDFVRAVARNRGAAWSDVRNGYGEGRVVGAREAKKLGMIDGIKTLSEVANIARNGALGSRLSASSSVSRQIRSYLRSERTQDLDRLTMLYSAWGAFNAEFFGGRLNLPRITVANLTSQKALANCSLFEKPAVIRFDASYFTTATRDSLNDTLLHEMIHQALGQLYPEHSNDKSGNWHHAEFAAICNRIAKQRGWPDVSENLTTGSGAARYWPPRKRETKPSAAELRRRWNATKSNAGVK